MEGKAQLERLESQADVEIDVKVLKARLNASSINQLKAITQIRRDVDKFKGLADEIEEEAKNGGLDRSTLAELLSR